MILKLFKKVPLAILFIIFTLQINGQSGISFTAGVAGAKNHLESISSGATGIGYTGAIEARFLGQDMYFVTQLQYAKYKLIPISGYEFATSENNFQVFHGKIGMGFTLFRLGYNTILRMKVLGCLDKVNQYTSAAIRNTNYSKMNNSTVGVLLGFGADLK